MINECGIDYRSKIRYNCIFHHCEQDMGASIDCCTLKGLGDCPCSDVCKDYIDVAEVYKLGLEAVRKQQKNNYYACSLCNDIKKIEQYNNKKINPWDRPNAIVQKEDKTFGLWIECDDWYYSGVAMEIYYCPICGRKLK